MDGIEAVETLLRVGLATDLDSFVVPCCQSLLFASPDAPAPVEVTELRVEPKATTLRAATYSLQLAALKDERQARGLEEWADERFETPVSTLFDAGSDLYKVRIGEFGSREEAEQVRRQIKRLGLTDSWIVTHPAKLENPRLLLREGDTSREVAGRWLALAPAEGAGVRIGQTRYRGRILLFLNDRGLLNLVNELSVEDYLRGVVPREMGPAAFANLEALKAQAVAARTYTLRNLGEFVSEGYDICATPRCQVYGGMDVEHALSDQAIAETAGIVLVWNGELVDALYSSTCGGHTEDVERIFPTKRHPYLRGVPCVEAGVERFGGGRPSGSSLATVVVEDLLPLPGSPDPAAGLEIRLRKLAILAGLALPEDRLASMERAEIRRYIASIFDLAIDPMLLHSRTDLEALVARPPSAWAEADRRLAGYLVESRVLASDNGELTAAESYSMVFELALMLGVVEIHESGYLNLEGRRLSVSGEDGSRVLELSESVAVFQDRGEGPQAAVAAMRPGDPIDLYTTDGRVVALVHRTGAAESLGTPANRRLWRRFRSDERLAQLVRAVYPELDLTGLEIRARGVSGRVTTLRLLGRGGAFEDVNGLAIRWTLDLPDTLFTIERSTPSQGTPGWSFSGRGWGHGVGMCQVGAFGMAQRGVGYQQILKHYYSGVELARLRPVRDRTAAVHGG